MKICVVGAGAIGGLLAARLAASGQDVTVVARGGTLEAIRNHGLRLTRNGVEEVARVAAIDTMSAAGPQDLIILGVKAHQVGDIAAALPQAFHGDTTVLTAQNGIPWWYFDKSESPYQGTSLQSVDPGGRIRQALPVNRVVGAVVYPAAEVIAPGHIVHVEGERFSVGEIDGAETPRIKAVSDALRGAGFKAPILSDIRAELWTKLWGNLSFNPISALTHATLAEICQHGPTRGLAAAMMKEAQTVAETLGIRFRVSLERRIAGAEAVGNHKTSMLQDVEAGRFVEVDALLGSVAELGRLTATATPHIDAVLACVTLLQGSLAKAGGHLRIEPQQAGSR